MDEDAFFGSSPTRSPTLSSSQGRLRSPTYAQEPPDLSLRNSGDSTSARPYRLSHSIRGSIVGYLDSNNNRPSFVGIDPTDVPAFVPNPAFDQPNNSNNSDDTIDQDIFGDVDDFEAQPPLNTFAPLPPTNNSALLIPTPSGHPPPSLHQPPPSSSSSPPKKKPKNSKKRPSGPRGSPKTTSKTSSTKRKSNNAAKDKKKAQPRTTQIFLHGTLIPPPSTMTRASPSPPRIITSTIPKPAAAAPSIKVERAVHGLSWRGGGDHKPSALALATLKMLAHRKAQSRRGDDGSPSADSLDEEGEEEKKEKERIKEIAKRR